MDWIFTALSWYVYLLILGILAYPLTARIFRSFFDKGYAFAKTIAILALSYIMFVAGTLHVLPFTQTGLMIILFVFLGIFLLLGRKGHRLAFPTLRFTRMTAIFLFEEVLFLSGLLFLTYVRGQEPSLRGLEKFMDYGFINSLLRSRFFPPLDMWYAGGFPINYYYFGHLTGAVLIRLTDVVPAVGYNLILATIFAQGLTLVFSLAGNIIYLFSKSVKHAFVGGLIGSFIVNLAGNLHTVYLFTTGYNTDNPVPFWQILSSYNPAKYWYPNATRFIPFTIHEFPSYSYVVADLHGHVFDIPFVLLTLAILFLFFLRHAQKTGKEGHPLRTYVPYAVAIGFMAAVHYMTNAFDGPIYLLLTGILMFVMFGFDYRLFFSFGLTLLSFLVFSYPFSAHFTPFVSGIGMNCSPDFLVNLGKLGPFLFEKGNCQPDPLWMLLVLWGFFWVNFFLFFLAKYFHDKQQPHPARIHLAIDDFIFLLFTFGTLLIFIPEFFYIKDIYPAHFRANTMFKLGYQAFIIMGVSCAYVFYRIITLRKVKRALFLAVFAFFFAFVFVYPFFSFPSYYGSMQKTPRLDGIAWLNSFYPEDREIIDFLNARVKGQPTILEAQGDSYTDYERISAYTGLPTVAGWWVHEWLWRGSSDVVGKRIPDVVALYESRDLNVTRQLLRKYNIKYVVVSRLEREKYKNIYEDKFNELGTRVFTSSNRFGALYQIK